MRLGELCAGYGGLGMAVEEVFGATAAWFSEYDAAPSKILAHHWPDVPNYGDMTKIDWADIEHVDIISGGTPCQDLSAAGRRAGMTTVENGSQQGASEARSRPRVVLASVWVPAPADWLNSNHRLHRMASAKLSAAWRESAAGLVEGAAPFGYTVRIVAHIWKPRRGRYDPNNLAPTTKACVDGFVDAGLFVDDDWNHVLGPDHRHGGIGPAGVVFEFTAA